MMAPWRPLAIAAALNVIVVVDVTTAQTVMVTKAPRGGTIELALNAKTIGTATADGTGKATLPVNLSAQGGRTEADVQVFVDACGNLRRVLLVEPGLQPQPPQIGCTRKELPGVFLMRQVTTMVVEVAASSPALWLRQGPVPTSWLGEQSSRISSKQERRPSPTGLILFGGGGLTTISDAKAVACGSLEACSGKDSRVSYTAGASVWVMQFLGVEASYTKPAAALASGSSSYFHFDTALKTSMLTTVAKIAIPLGAVRFYALAGANRHQATLTTNETMNDRPYTNEDGTAGIFAGGTQAFVLKTAGWGLTLGGGVEVWMAPKFGIYGEIERAKLKGDSRDGDPGRMDDRATSFRVGLRYRLFGR